MSRGTARRRWVALVLLGGATVVAAGVVATAAVNRQTQQSLLERQTNEVAAVLTTSIAGLLTPLAAAAEQAEVTDGQAAPFEAVMSRSLGADGQFASAALVEAASGRVLATAGEDAMLLAAGTDRVRSMIEQADAAESLAVVDLSDLPGRRLGYAYQSNRPGVRYVVYTEQDLPTERTSAARPSGAFAELDYALYLGRGEREGDLLYASVDELPIDEPRAVADVAFGDTRLVVVTTSDARLGGDLPARLPWIVAIVGGLLAIGAAAATDQLLRRREHAERLARHVSHLYAQQRHHSETLQRSLMPRELTPPPGMTVAGRYWPGHADAEIGGDFYDLFQTGDHRWAVAIGDVCGQGIEAAALTGLTRHTIRAAARHLDDPAEVLRWTHDALRSYSGDTYSTACVGLLVLGPDGGARLDVALGGHPPPLRCRTDGTVEWLGTPGTLLGMLEPELVATSHHLSPGDTVVLYTDGITDAPGALAVSDDELADLVVRHRAGGPERLADAIREALDERRPAGSGDDTALLVLRLDASS